MAENKKKLTHIDVKDNGIKLSNKVGDKLSEAVNDLENKISNKLIKSIDKTPNRWLIEQNNQIRLFKRESKEVIAKTKEAVKTALNSDNTVNLKITQNNELTKNLGIGLQFLRQDAIKTYESMVQKTLLTIRNQKAIDLKEALSKHLSSGMNLGVVYKDGKNYQFDSYFEMKARTEIQTEIKDNMIEAGNAAGVIFYITSFYGDCAIDHADYQGKIYYDVDWKSNAPKDRIDEIEDYINSNKLKTVQEITEAPVFLTSRPNCRHYFMPIDIDSVLGAKTEKDVNKLRQENGLNFNGKYKPEKYKALQQQRLNERKIRAEKQEIERNELRLQLDPTNKRIQSSILAGEQRVRNYQAAQRDLIKQYNNLERRYDREALGNRVTLGADRIVDNQNVKPIKSEQTSAIEDIKEEYTLIDNEQLEKTVSNHFDGETKILKDFVNKANTKDENVNKILANIDKLPTIKISKAKRSAYNGNNGIALASQKDVRVAYHEFGHSLDHQVAYAEKWETENRKFHWLSDDIENVRIEARDGMNNTIPQEFMDKMKEQITTIQDAVKAEIPAIREKVLSTVNSKYKGELPSSILKGVVEDELQKEVQKSYLKYAQSNQDYTRWSCLSDIYDAITDGNAKNAKGLTGSHGWSYYNGGDFAISFTTTGNVKKQNTEIFANFVEMKMGDYKEQLDFFKNDQPKLYNELENKFAYVAKYLEEKK